MKRKKEKKTFSKTDEMSKGVDDFLEVTIVDKGDKEKHRKNA